MAKLQPPKSTTSKLARVVVKNSATGAFLTGLVYNTSGLTAYYIREGDSTTTAISLVSATLGTWASGGFVVVDATNMPGVYELGIPNACFASGNSFVIYLQGAANMICNPIEFESTSVSNQDGVRGGMTALPNAAASASGGLPTFGTGSGQINPNGSGAVPASTLNGVVPPTNWASESIDSSGRVLLQPTQTGVTIPTVTTVGSVTGSVGSISGITFPSNFGTFSIDSSGRVTLIPGDVPPSTSAIAAAILATPAHLLATDASGDVTFNNTSIGAVTGAVGSISGITFPSNFGTFSIDSSGRVLLQPTQTGVTIPTVTTVGSVTGSVGSISGITFPSNFGTFSIDSSGRVTLTPTNNALIVADVAAVVPTDASITTDVETALTAQGYTSVRAGYLDTLNGIVANIWAYATRTLSAFAFGVTVTANNDKAGYSLSTSDRTSATINNLTQGAGGTQQFTAEALALAPTGGGSGFSGPYNVTFQFNDASSSPVPYVQFSVPGVGDATTNGSGVITVGMNANSYSVSTVPNSGVMWSTTAFTVAGNRSVTIEGTAVPVPSPASSPGDCVAYIAFSPGFWSGSETATLKIISLPQNIVGGFLSAYSQTVTINNSTGLITFSEIPQGAQVQISCAVAGISATYYLPPTTLYQITH